MKKNTFQNRLARGIALVTAISMLVPTPVLATGTTPNVFVYQGRLLDSSGNAITTARTFRFSFWKSGDWTSSDTTGGGAVNTGATNYGGWNEVQTVTPTSLGIFSVNLGSVTSLPTIDYVQHKYLQVEVKETAGADTTYQLIDTTGDAGSDSDDRMTLGSLPYTKNSESIENRVIGTGSGNVLILGPGGKVRIAQMGDGISGTSFKINNDDTAADAILTFGNSTLTQTLKFSHSNQRFEFTKDLHVTGNIAATGTLSGSSFYGAGLGSCNGANQKVIYNNSTGKFSCGTDASGSQFSNTGSLQSGFDARYVRKSGDTMTGTLNVRANLSGSSLTVDGAAAVQSLSATTTISATGNISTAGNATINSGNAASDAILTFGNSTLTQTLKFSHSNQRFEFTKDLYITGALGVTGAMSGMSLNVNTTATIGGAATFNGVATHNANVKVRGNLSGSTLTVDQLRNCNTIDTDANGNLVCGTDATGGGASGTGTAIEDADRNTKVRVTPNDTITMTVAGKDRLTISGTTLTVSGSTTPVTASTFQSLTRAFASPDTAGTVGQHTSIKIGTDNLPVISYYDATNGDLKVTKCGDATCSSGNTTSTLAASGNVGSYTSLAIGSDGFPIIAYYDVDSSRLYVAKCSNASCSSGTNYYLIDADAAGVGIYSSIAIGTDTFPVISYYVIGTSDLKVAKCGNISCSSGNTITTVESSQAVGYYSSIAIGADGFPVISHRDGSSGYLRVLKCGNAACTAGNTASLVDSTANVGYYSNIIIGTDGNPVISYRDATNGPIKVAKCGNPDCSSGNTLSSLEAVDSHYNSIAIGSDGFPVIAYYSAQGGANDLKVAKCGNAACSSGNTYSTIDTTGTVGYYISLAIAPSGYPIISYSNETDGDLRVASCADRTCSATTGGTYTAGNGHDIGSPSNFYKTIFASAIKLKTPSGFLTFSGVGNPSLDVSALHDADNDTKIQAEEGTDEDVLRFDTAGIERFTINAAGLAAFSGAVRINNGKSLNVTGTMSGRSLYVTGTGSNPLLFTNIANKRVGIGTATPTNMFDITTGDTTNSAFHLGETQNKGAYLTSIADGQFSLSTGAEFVAGSTVARHTSASVIQNLDGVLSFLTDSALTIGNTFTPTERMRIGTDGKVGIGTSAPETALDVAGTISGSTLVLSNSGTKLRNVQYYWPTAAGASGTALKMGPNGSLSWGTVSGGSSSTTFQTVTNTNATVTDWGYTVLVTAGAASRTITLPTASGNTGEFIEVKKVDSGTGTVYIDGYGSEEVDTSSGLTLIGMGQSAVLRSNGTTVTATSNFKTDDSNVVGSFAQIVRTAAQTTDCAGGGLGTNDRVCFSSVPSSYGSDITVNTTAGASQGKILLKAGKTYRLFGSVGALSANGGADNYVAFRWFDADAGAAIAGGLIGSIESSAETSSDALQSYAEAIFTPSTDTNVELRLTTIGSSTSSIGSTTYGLPRAFIEVIAGNAPVIGQSVDYIHAIRSSSNQGSIGAGTDLVWNSVMSGNIPLNTTTGVFTLTAGKTYQLSAGPRFVSYSSANANTVYEWVDAVSNSQLISGTGLGTQYPMTATDQNSMQTYATVIYTPTTNQTVKVRVTILSSGTTEMQSNSSWVNIVQLGSSALTSDTIWSTSGNRLTSTGSLGTTGTGSAARGLQFMTNNTTRLTIDTAGLFKFNGDISVVGTLSGRTLNVSGSGTKLRGTNYFWPTSIAGGSGSVLKTQGNGNLYWGTAGGGGAVKVNNTTNITEGLYSVAAAKMTGDTFEFFEDDYIRLRMQAGHLQLVAVGASRSFSAYGWNSSGTAGSSPMTGDAGFTGQGGYQNADTSTFVTVTSEAISGDYDDIQIVYIQLNNRAAKYRITVMGGSSLGAIVERWDLDQLTANTKITFPD